MAAAAAEASAPTMSAPEVDWSDLTPIPQADSAIPLVPILYSTRYRDAMGLFRALVQKQELSERGLDLTSRIVQLNPAHYSVWAWRAQTLLHLHAADPTKGHLSRELSLMDDLVSAHLKSYQIWQHRRNVVVVLNDPSRELPFVDRALAIDPKNYHTWAYRQWALCYFNKPEMWASELPFINRLLDQDIRNNSAYNHRFFLFFESPYASSPESGVSDTAKLTEDEIEWCKSTILKAPNNPSAWNYLRGVLKHAKAPLPALAPFAAPLAQPGEPAGARPEGLAPAADLPCAQAVEFLADALVENAQAGAEGAADRAQEAAALYDSLAQQLDPIRKRYWAHRKKLALKSGRAAGPAPSTTATALA